LFLASLLFSDSTYIVFLYFEIFLASFLITFLAAEIAVSVKGCVRVWSVAAHLLRLWVRLPPGPWIFVCCECHVLSGRGLCDELIAPPEESYRLCCVVVCDLETSRICIPYIYDISHLRVKRTNSGTSTALSAEHIDLRAHEFAHSAHLWQQSRLSSFTCIWSWRLCGIKPFILVFKIYGTVGAMCTACGSYLYPVWG
jgi:hypothetical protein